LNITNKIILALATLLAYSCTSKKEIATKEGTKAVADHSNKVSYRNIWLRKL